MLWMLTFIAFERYRSRVAQLSRNNLAILIEGQLVSPDSLTAKRSSLFSTRNGMSTTACRFTRRPRCPRTFMLHCLMALNLLYQKTGEHNFSHSLKKELQDRVATDFRPLRLPDDSKQLCALTNALEETGLPGTNYGYVPHAFDGLEAVRESLRMHSADQMIKESCLDYLNYKVAVSIWMGGTLGAISGGYWLCWCKDDRSEIWKWRWAVRLGWENPPRIYDNVMELLDKHWKDWLSNIIQKYGDIGQDDL